MSASEVDGRRSRQLDESAETENHGPSVPGVGLDGRTNFFASSSRRRSIFIDISFYRTRLPDSETCRLFQAASAGLAPLSAPRTFCYLIEKKKETWRSGSDSKTPSGDHRQAVDSASHLNRIIRVRKRTVFEAVALAIELRPP